ncbi:MAG: SpoIIE family protein phosphatase [Silvibacterium sp.]
MRRLLFSLLTASLFASSAFAQGLSTPGTAPQTSITLGHSAIALNGPWRFHIGDNPQWSDPSFDDSAWETTNVGVAADSFDPGQGTPGFVPGWTGKGHPSYSGYAWYRIQVRLTGVDAPVTLLAPDDVDDSYQVFVNGHLLGSFGDFSGSVPTVYVTQPRMFQIPASVIQNSPGGNLQIAFRFYMAPRELLQVNSPGGMHNPPYIGFTDAIVPVYHVKWEDQYLQSSSLIVNFLIYLLFTLLILMLYVFDRTERILLLPLAACACSALDMLISAFSNTSMHLTAIQQVYAGAIIIAAFRALWAITWWAYFDLQQKKWIRNAIIVITVFYAAVKLLFPWLTTSGPKAPHFIFNAYRLGNQVTDAAIITLLILIAYYGIRKAPKVDWMLLLALIFYGLPNLYYVYKALHIRIAWFPFGVDVPLVLLTSLASLFCFSFVLMRRFRASQRRQQAMVEDVKQAQEVQQVLIPEELPQVPGLTIESEYRPAREVGGDFFQIIPHASDGSVLIVAGDVTGKGLKAGMLVAVLVGGIRSTVELNPDPVFLLKALNRRLIGRGDAHATALAMRIAADGSITLANAGHLPPYLNGKPVPVEGALPLGTMSNPEPSITRFKLNEGDRLVLVSDGIAEAMDADGKLFGFERIEQLLASDSASRPVSVAALAEAAQEFGQEDDISVIAVTREHSMQAAFA